MLGDFSDIRTKVVRDRLLSLVEVTDLTAEGILQAVLVVLSKFNTSFLIHLVLLEKKRALWGRAQPHQGFDNGSGCAV
jgi:hypothetical protein